MLTTKFRTNADALISAMPDGRAQLYIDMNKIFFELKLPAYEEQVDGLVSQADQKGTDWLYTELHILHTQYMENLLLSHGLIMNKDEEPNLHIYVAILHTLITIPYIDAAADIEDILEGNENDLPFAIGLLVELVADVDDTITGMKVSQAIEDVDYSLVEAILRTVKETEAPGGVIPRGDVLNVIGDGFKQHAMNRFNGHAIAATSTLINDFLKSGGSFGTPATTLWLHLKDSLYALLDAEDYDAFTRELFALVVISDVTNTMLDGFATTLLNTNVSDDKQIMAVSNIYRANYQGEFK